MSLLDEIKKGNFKLAKVKVNEKKEDKPDSELTKEEYLKKQIMLRYDVMNKKPMILSKVKKKKKKVVYSDESDQSEEESSSESESEDNSSDYY